MISESLIKMIRSGNPQEILYAIALKDSVTQPSDTKEFLEEIAKGWRIYVNQKSYNRALQFEIWSYVYDHGEYRLFEKYDQNWYHEYSGKSTEANR